VLLTGFPLPRQLQTGRALFPPGGGAAEDAAAGGGGRGHRLAPGALRAVAGRRQPVHRRTLRPGLQPDAAGHSRRGGTAAEHPVGPVRDTAAGGRDTVLAVPAHPRQPRGGPAGVQPPDAPAAERNRGAQGNRPRPATGQGAGRERQQRQEPLPLRPQPRAAHPPAIHSRLRPVAQPAGGDPRKAPQRAPHHQAQQRIPHRPDRGTAGYLQDRGRPARHLSQSRAAAGADRTDGGDVPPPGGGQRHSLLLPYPQPAAVHGDRGRETAAADPHQPAFERHQVHPRGAGGFPYPLPQPGGGILHRRYRHRHSSRRPRARPQTLRAGAQRRGAGGHRHRPRPDHLAPADGNHGRGAARGERVGQRQPLYRFAAALLGGLGAPTADVRAADRRIPGPPAHGDGGGRRAGPPRTHRRPAGPPGFFAAGSPERRGMPGAGGTAQAGPVPARCQHAGHERPATGGNAARAGDPRADCHALGGRPGAAPATRRAGRGQGAPRCLPGQAARQPQTARHHRPPAGVAVGIHRRHRVAHRCAGSAQTAAGPPAIDGTARLRPHRLPQRRARHPG